MRLIMGILIGIVLTIGVAFVHDRKVSGPFAEQQRLVNWDVAGALVRRAYDGIRNQIGDIVGG